MPVPSRIERRSFARAIDDAESELRDLARRRKSNEQPDAKRLQALSLSDRLEAFLRDDTAQLVKLEGVHRRWLWHIEDAHARGLHAGVMGPPGQGKTALLVIGLTLDRIGREPRSRIQIVSAADPIATKRVRAIRSVIQRSPDYHRIYPKVRLDPSQRSAHEFSIERDVDIPDPTLTAYGVTSSGTGSRSGLTIFDDMDDAKSVGQDWREWRWEMFSKVWMRRLDSGCRAIMAANAWHEEDTAHRLRRTKGWAWMITAVARDKSGFESIRIVND